MYAPTAMKIRVERKLKMNWIIGMSGFPHG